MDYPKFLKRILRKKESLGIFVVWLQMSTYIYQNTLFLPLGERELGIIIFQNS